MASYARGTTEEFVDLVAEITNDTLAKSPAWEANSENPPISARRAIDLAGKVKDALVRDTDDWEWHLESATLRKHVVKWFWIVTYRASIKHGGLAGGAPYLELPVLMDGQAIRPTKERK